MRVAESRFVASSYLSELGAISTSVHPSCRVSTWQGARGEHRFNRERHPGAQAQSQTAAVDVVDVRCHVHLSADSVPTEGADDREPFALGNACDGVADVSQARIGSHLLDACLQTALRCLHQASLVKRALVPAHGVVYAASGKQALAAIARGDVFDLILCDIMMPEMSGMDFHEELMLSASAQAAKMVFMTGGAFTTRAREFLERVSNPRLDMPLKRDQLRAFIDGLLG